MRGIKRRIISDVCMEKIVIKFMFYDYDRGGTVNWIMY